MSDPASPGRQRLIGRIVRLAQGGFPYAASQMAARYEIEFGAATLRRWRASAGKLATLAWLLAEERARGPGTGQVLAKDRRRQHLAHRQPARAGRRTRRRHRGGRDMFGSETWRSVRRTRLCSTVRSRRRVLT